MIIVQARMGSTRFPRKVLDCTIDGVPLIDRVISRCLDSTIRPIVVAIPGKDSKLSDHIGAGGLASVFDYDGPEDDLVARYLRVLEHYHFDAKDRCLRITADCGYHMSSEMDYVWRKGQAVDFCSNGWPEGRTTPDGVDCETYSLRLLNWMHRNIPAKDPVREHLPLYIYQHADELRARGFTLARTDWPVNLSHIKFSIDRPSDLLTHDGRPRNQDTRCLPGNDFVGQLDLVDGVPVPREGC
jgi:spore coat polysaccharide biosynthesis protein SpsF (cytidylyltransferase family)